MATLLVAPARRSSPADARSIIVVVEQLTPELVLVDPDLAERARAQLPDPADCLAPPPPRRAAPRVVAPAAAPRPAADLPAPSAPRERPAPPAPSESPVPPRRRTVAPHPRPLDDPPRAHPAVEQATPARAPERVAPRRRRLRLGSVARSGTWAVVALFLLSPLLAFLPASSSQLPTLVAPVSGAATATGPASAPTQPPAESTSASETTAASSPPSKPKAKSGAPRPGAKASTPTTKATGTTPAARRPTTIEWPATSGAVVYNVIFVAGEERVDVWTETTRLALGDAATRDLADKRDYTWFAYPGFREGKAVRYGDLAAHGQVRIARTAIPKTQPPAGGQTR